MPNFGQLMQKVVMSNPKWADAFQSKMPPSFFEKKGRALALQTFKTAAARVPAYKDFLKKHNINPQKIKTFTDFQKLPLIDKQNYLRVYPLEDLCLDGRLSQMYTVSVSSGSTGEPFFWPMLPRQFDVIPPVMDLVYSKFYQVDTKPTLIVITLALGTWAAGVLASEATRVVARKPNYPLTVVTPGLDLVETLKIIKGLAKKYQQTLLVGYPPFVKDLLEQGKKEGIDWSSIEMGILVGGERVSEEWRDWVVEKSGIKDPSKIINLFATADAGIVGFETPYSIKISRAARDDKKLARRLFGEGSTLPSFVQYNPMARFLEAIDGELVLTAALGIPLVRYNIHDRGGVLPFIKVHQLLPEERAWRLPFFYCFGRANAATVYGVNIYTENIQSAIEKAELHDLTTRRFQFKTGYDEKQNQFLEITIELKGGLVPGDELLQKFIRVIGQTLEEKSSEYCRLRAEKGDTVLPRVRLVPFREGEFAKEDKIKINYLAVP